MYYYLIVLDSKGNHFFATRHYFELHFVQHLAKRLHALLPDCTIKLCKGEDKVTMNTLYTANNDGNNDSK